MAQKKSGEFAENVKTIIYALLIALVIRSFLFQPFNIPSGSMIPTLLVGIPFRSVRPCSAAVFSQGRRNAAISPSSSCLLMAIRIISSAS